MKEEQQAEGYIGHARIKLDEAREHLGMGHYAESVEASQESLEFSVKALFLSVDIEFSPKHEIKESEFSKVIEKLSPEELNIYNFPKILLMAVFWSKFYLIAKYGFEKLHVGADKLFNKAEAELAEKHASACYSACLYIYNQKRYPPK